MINVTKTYLPPLSEYSRYLKKIWESSWVTNNGPMVVQLENQLKKYLGVKHLFLVNNATVGLQIAIKALDLNSEIITTPFSYVATTSVISWENCKPVFADINASTLCINPDLIIRNITPKTQAILPTHVYGYPCEVEKISKIAKKFKLKIIYDAAHCFGVKYRDKSILNWGDISILSFHATKIFHTIEGGALITSDDRVAHRISYMRNFGHKTAESFWGIGINGKISEFHAAMGLCMLSKMKKIIAKRKSISEYYDKLLSDMVIRPLSVTGLSYNYAYYPVIFDSEKTMLKAKSNLNQAQIYPRRYFFPSLNTLEYVHNESCPISEKVSKQVLCLPLYYDLTKEQIKQIVKIIRSS